MRFKSFVLIISLIAFARTARCHGHRIYYPDEDLSEIPDVFDALDLSKISTRFNFPSDDGFCVNEFGQEGECVFVRQCPELMNVLRKSGGIRTVGDINFFRSRICRLLESTVQLCCFPETRSAVAEPDSLILNPATSGSIIPPTEQCGFSKVRRITDGQEYTHGTHPWLAGVGFQRNDGSFRVLCGGTLITRKHVITAAHCFVRQAGQRELTHVIVGEHSLSSNIEREPPVVLKITDKKDPGYNRVSHVNDISIATLERDVRFSNFIRPVCLPFELQGQDFENSRFTIIGWGDTFHLARRGNDVPLTAEISGVTKAKCRESYRDEPQVPLDKTQFCADGGTKDACQGDSGGPLLYQDLQKHQRYFLIGIVSFGVECANPAFPGVYTFVPEFLNWIKDNLKD